MPKIRLPAAIHRPLAYATGLFASKGIALLMLPVVANRLTLNEVGQIELYTSGSVFLGLLLGLALHEALYRFAGQEHDPDRQATIAGQILTLSAAIAMITLVTLLGGLLLIHSFTNAFPVVDLALLATGVSTEGLTGLLLAWLRMQDRATDFVRVTLSICLLQVTLIALSLWLYPGVTGILAASVIAHIVQLLWLHKLCGLKTQYPSPGRSKTFIRYSLPIALSGLLAFALNGAERWVIAGYDSIEVLARYGIAAKFALALCILVQPFGMWWMPKRFATLDQQGKTAATQTTQYGLVWIAMLCAFMAYFAPLFIALALPDGYQLAGQLVLLCLLAATGKEITELVNLGVLARKQTGLLLRFNLIATATGAISMVCLLPFGIWGIISALILAQFLKLALVYQASQRLLPLPYQLKPLALLFSVTALHLLASALINHWHWQLLLSFLSPVTVLLIAAFTGLLPVAPLLSRYTLRRIRNS